MGVLDDATFSLLSNSLAFIWIIAAVALIIPEKETDV